MMKHIFLLLAALLVLVAPVAAQSGTECAAPLIELGSHATLLTEVGTYMDAGFNNDQYGTLPAGDMIQVLPESTIRCIDGVNWYESSSMTGYGWIPESVDGQATMTPYVFTPEAPIPFDIPLVQPVITNPDVPLPTVTPSANPSTLDGAFADWDWDAFLEGGYQFPPTR